MKTTRSPCPSPDRAPRSPCCGDLVEVFSGIQGEGLHVGERHIFLRLAGCNLGCAYCDQLEARTTPRRALIERTPGRRDFLRVPNPIPVDLAAEAVLRLARRPGLHRCLAVTGGEPLLQAQFLKTLLQAIKVVGLRILLETNGTRPDALGALLPYLDVISMDFKLRSSTGRPAPLMAHRRFLRAAARCFNLYVKAVVSSRTTQAEVARMCRIVREVAGDVPLVLQPVTPVRRGRPRRPDAGQLLLLQEAALRFLTDVRVIPQAHRLMGQR